MATTTEIDAMRRALTLARQAQRTLPNPPVGCVLLSPDGETIAEGYHRGAGHPHAEVEALARASDLARGATAVVTLEPCSHTGRTGPCVDALSEAKVARVVYATSDPNPQGAGGAQVLRERGIDVEAGVLLEEGEALIAVWAHQHRTGRPYVTWKFAATLDGRSAAADGTSQWISGPESRRDVHALRAACDAIVVGTGTVLSDNPQLTVRDAADRPLPRAQQPLRVIVGHSDIPDEFHVHDGTARSLFVSEHDPGVVLDRLGAEGIHHLWLEGGPHVAGAWLDAGVIDRIVAYIAPSLLGAGTSAIEGGATTLTDRQELRIEQVDKVGEDLRVIATPIRPTPDGDVADPEERDA